MNGTVVPDKIKRIYVNLFLFPLPAHGNAESNVLKYLRHACARFGRGKK